MRETFKIRKLLGAAAAKSATNTDQATPKQSKFRENRRLPIRSAAKSSAFYWFTSTKLWHWLVMSVPLDLIVFLLPLNLPKHFTNFLLIAANIGMLTAASGLLREHLIDFADWLRANYNRMIKHTQSYSWVAIFIALGFVAFELIGRFGDTGILVLAGFAIVGLRVFVASRKMISRYKDQRRAVENDKTLLLSDLNRSLFVFTVVPIVGSRLSLLFYTVHTQATGGSISMWGLAATTNVALLFLLAPAKEHYMIQCRRCARWTSRALKNVGYCPACAREEFQVQKPEPMGKPSPVQAPSKARTRSPKDLIRSIIKGSLPPG